MSGDRDIGATFSASSKIGLGETERLLFAKQLLVVITLIVVVAGASYAYSPDNKALIAIFDLIKIGVLPLVTLVVAFALLVIVCTRFAVLSCLRAEGVVIRLGDQLGDSSH